MINQPCSNCKGRFKTLTKEGLCAYCYKLKYDKWAKDFTEPEKGKK